MTFEVNWQTTKSSIRERTKFMFNNDLFSDVKFVVDNGGAASEGKQPIAAHKFVLSIGSPVFEAMFYGKLAETRDAIELPDCEYESLLELFRYMYSDEVNLNGNNVMGVLYLAKKYMVPSLVEICTKYLQENLNASNVFSILPMADKYEELDLVVDQCWEMIDEVTEEALNSQSFASIERSLLEEVVARDTLSIKEVALFQAVDLWATKQCEKLNLKVNGESKRNILGESIIKTVRFPLMTQKEFATVVLDKDILTSDEMKRFFQFFSSALTSPLGFSETRRLGPVHRCRRFESVAVDTQSHVNKQHFLCFSVNKDITLHGVCLCGNKESSYVATLKFMKMTDSWLETIISKSGTFSSELLQYRGRNRYHGFKILFDSSLYLKKNTKHVVMASITGPPSCMGVKGKAIIQSSDVTFNFSSVHWINTGDQQRVTSMNNDTSERGGQFTEFLFN